MKAKNVDMKTASPIEIYFDFSIGIFSIKFGSAPEHQMKKFAIIF